MQEYEHIAECILNILHEGYVRYSPERQIYKKSFYSQFQYFVDSYIMFWEDSKQENFKPILYRSSILHIQNEVFT